MSPFWHVSPACQPRWGVCLGARRHSSSFPFALFQRYHYVMARKKLTIEDSRRLAQVMLDSPRLVFRKPASPAKLPFEIDPDELFFHPELRWFDCPSYDHCLYIAVLAHWNSWTCKSCPVRVSRAGNGKLDKLE